MTKQVYSAVSLCCTSGHLLRCAQSSYLKALVCLWLLDLPLFRLSPALFATALKATRWSSEQRVIYGHASNPKSMPAAALYKNTSTRIGDGSFINSILEEHGVEGGYGRSSGAGSSSRALLLFCEAMSKQRGFRMNDRNGLELLVNESVVTCSFTEQITEQNSCILLFSLTNTCQYLHMWVSRYLSLRHTDDIFQHSHRSSCFSLLDHNEPIADPLCCSSCSWSFKTLND